MADLAKQLLQPAALLWVALIAMGGWQVYRKQYRWAGINGAFVLLLFIFGSTPASRALVGTLEQPYRTGPDGNATADAVIVLGGFTSGGDEEPSGMDVGEAFDRVLAGLELVKAGKAKQIIFGGGWYETKAGPKSELSVLEPWLKRMGLDDVPVSGLGNCANTYEESVATKKLMDENSWDRVFLVTSAWHLPRARAVFASSGVNVIPVGCDFRSVPGDDWVLFPQHERLGHLKVFMREKIGWMYYRSKGWIRLEALAEE